ncbi:conserved hypothetical protein [Pediculus humanus corporis]|uniref:EF-hand domain-containing protein n=1 Tax=Pediculus humanus subsp. corporis TaxID=121224 RepID=E0VWV4_PEDHC|nr:uncharacterized protein Phum_PHUM491380 [Pediculus humanus corporis]EEB17860.1 conserved hypothetical protein [Pediculus humanus corporis]
MNFTELIQKKDDDYVGAVKLTSRERRFIKFASVEYDGQLYMTPQDFLESVVEQEPRPRLKRRYLTDKEIEKIKDDTPPLKNGNSEMFRKLRDKEPQSGFRIAFNMFDTDGNERVDKNEFLVLVDIIGKHGLKEIKSRECDTKSQTAMEKIFSQSWKDKRGLNSKNNNNNTNDATKSKSSTSQEDYVDDEQGLQRRHSVDTTLIVHFFGKKGKDELKFEGFRRFMENLQSEVLELEFHEFSKGHKTISEVDFAKILLRYTYLDTDEYDRFLNRLLDRVKEEKGITIQEFKAFCQFLNNLEDFAIAMKMYTLADHPISEDEFYRAVKICTGKSLSRHMIHTVFAIFDEDGDGHLSYREFIAIMKERLHRGFKSYAKNEGWDAFKFCVKQEMKTPN